MGSSSRDSGPIPLPMIHAPHTDVLECAMNLPAAQRPPLQAHCGATRSEKPAPLPSASSAHLGQRVLLQEHLQPLPRHGQHHHVRPGHGRRLPAALEEARVQHGQAARGRGIDGRVGQPFERESRGIVAPGSSAHLAGRLLRMRTKDRLAARQEVAPRCSLTCPGTPQRCAPPPAGGPRCRLCGAARRQTHRGLEPNCIGACCA